MWSWPRVIFPPVNASIEKEALSLSTRSEGLAFTVVNTVTANRLYHPYGILGLEDGETAEDVVTRGKRCKPSLAAR